MVCAALLTNLDDVVSSSFKLISASTCARQKVSGIMESLTKATITLRHETQSPDLVPVVTDTLCKSLASPACVLRLALHVHELLFKVQTIQDFEVQRKTGAKVVHMYRGADLRNGPYSLFMNFENANRLYKLVASLCPS